MSHPPRDPSESGSGNGEPDAPAYGSPGYGRPTPSGEPTSPYGSSYGSPAGTQSGAPTGPAPAYGQPGSTPPGQPTYGQPTQPPYGPPAQGWSQPTPAQYGSDIRQSEQAYAQMYGQKPKTGLAIAALVVGILALIGCWIPVVSYGALVLAILAVVFGIIGMRRVAGKGMALAGLIIGSIALIGAIGFSIFYTNLFIDGYQIATECADEYPGLGAAYDQCVNERAGEIMPFG